MHNPQFKELMDTLERDYPNDVFILAEMNEIERERYIAQLQLIERIKQIINYSETKD